jgi:hypothetical protein
MTMGRSNRFRFISKDVQAKTEHRIVSALTWLNLARGEQVKDVRGLEARWPERNTRADSDIAMGCDPAETREIGRPEARITTNAAGLWPAYLFSRTKLSVAAPTIAVLLAD